MKQYALSDSAVTTAIIARSTGTSYAAIARHFNVAPSTVSAAIDRNNDRFTLFDTHSKPGFAVLANTDNILEIQHELIVKSVVVTGNPEDGTIYAKSIYISDYNGDTSEDDEGPINVSDWYFESTDVGVILPLVVGKIVIYGRDEETLKGVEGHEDITFDTGRKYHFSGKAKDLFVQTCPNEVPKVEKPKEKIVPIWNASNRFASITVGREVYNADSSHPEFKEILSCLIANDIDQAIELINKKVAVERYVKGNITIENGALFYKGLELKTGLTERIIAAMKAKQDFEFFLQFLENLMLNPSNKAVTRLFDFLQANDIEITKDGYFVAFKKVRSDYFDIYSNSFDNSPGKLVQMSRNQVNEDDNQTCSHGLHVCSKSYLGHFGTHSCDKVVSVKVHPRDVVSIPVDYANAKMRTCQYEVIADVTDKI